MSLRNLYCWFWWSSFILNVLTDCVCFTWLLVTRFREVCTDWRVFGASPCCFLLNSNNRCRVQVGLLKLVLPEGQWQSCKWRAVYINRVSRTIYDKMGVFVYDTSYDIKPQKNVDKGNHSVQLCNLHDSVPRHILPPDIIMYHYHTLL
jgi:hypothetical protein